MSNWHLYILRCSDNSLYTGVTTNVSRRVQEHNDGVAKRSKYTRSRLPVKLAYREPQASKTHALKREIQIKRWTKSKKEALILRDKIVSKN